MVYGNSNIKYTNTGFAGVKHFYLPPRHFARHRHNTLNKVLFSNNIYVLLTF